MRFTKLLIILPVLLSIGCQQQDVDALKVEAQNFMANSQNKKALITLKNALSIAPGDDELRAMSAIVNYKLGDYVSAVSMVERVQQPETLTQSYFERIEEVYVLANYQLENYEVVLQNLNDDLDQNKAAIKYLSLLQTRKPAVAESFANSFISSSSESDDFRSFYKALSKSRENVEYKDIISILESIDDEFSEKWLFLGKLYFANGSFVEAEYSFKEYLEHYPGNRRVSIYLANAQVQKKSYEESLEILESLVKNTGNAPIIDQMFAEVAFKAKRYSKAKIHTDSATAAGFKSPIVDYISAISSFYLGLYEQSFDSLQSIPNIVSKNQTLRNLEMLLLIRLGYELDTTNSNGMVEGGLGENIAISLLLKGQRAKASAVLAKTEPFSEEKLDVKQTLERAALEMGLGEKNRVAELSNAALDLDPSNLEARLLLAYNSISAGEYDEAMIAIENGLKIDSAYTPLLALAVKVSLMQKNTVEADKYSEVLSGVDKANETVLLYNVSKLVAEQHITEALNQIEKYSESRAFTTKVVETYFVLTQETKTWHKFISTVNKGVHKTNYDVSLLLARAYVAVEQFDEARSILDKFPLKNNRYFESLVELAYASNDISLLSRTLYEWVDRSDASVNAFLTCIQFFDSTGRVKEAVRVAKKGIEKFKDSKKLHYVYSEMMMLAGRTETAIDILKSELIKDEPLTQILLSKAEGINLLSKGNVEPAFTKLFQYYEGSQSKEKTSSLITTIEKISGTDDAIIFIALILDKYPEDLLAQRYYADAHIYTAPSKAIYHYEVIAAKEKGNVDVLNNLAWLLSRQDKFGIAHVYSARAYELAPKNISVRTTHAKILLQLKKYSEAKNVLASMVLEDKLMSLDLMLDYADALVGLSEKNEALEFLGTMAQKDFPKDIKDALKKHLSTIENN